jgi:hypothetical protein
MYTVDGLDKVVKLHDLPQSDVGAPCPVVLANEHSLIVAYFVREAPSDWDGTTVRVVAPNTAGEPAAIVRFSRPIASMFGPPNDEAFSGHPLAARGLRPYGAYEVQSSSWIRSLVQMNAVHPRHRAEHFAEHRHFVLAFHDSTFECVARGYSHEVTVGAVSQLIAQEAARLSA